MSNIHEGVSCDICSKSNFTGKRYKCLICYDFDQCESCHEQSINSSLALSKPINPTHNHSSSHPMQCILTKNDMEMFYGVPNAISDYGEQISFTCPYCGKNGFSESTLCDHLSTTHLNQPQNESLPTEVVCPICAALPNRACAGDPNHLTEDFLHHLNIEHTTTRNMIDIGADNLGNGSVAAAAALRFSRRLNYAQNPSSSGRGISIGRNNTFRFQFNNSSSGTNSALSSFMRTAGTGIDSFVTSSSGGGSDPIVELLSQLTGVRRAASNSHSGSLTLGQLTRERESLQSGTRHHIFTGSNSNKIGLSKLSNAANQSSGPNSSNQSSNQQSIQHVNQLLELPNCLLQQPLPANARDSRYLLSKYDFFTNEKQENQGQQQPSSNIIPMSPKQAHLLNDIILSLIRCQLTNKENENENSTNAVKQHQMQV